VARVITDTCTKDRLCVAVCPADCIHPTKDEPVFKEAPQLFVDPAACIDCGACDSVCPTNSVFSLDDVPPKKARFAKLNRAHYT
jgi:ferredoxin--NADP+ reductase